MEFDNPAVMKSVRVKNYDHQVWMAHIWCDEKRSQAKVWTKWSSEKEIVGHWFMSHVWGQTQRFPKDIHEK